ncbi:DsrE family protein [Pectinatus brassicae]|uniref:DsrE/DsrF-like family protein n=1 Tax=Pectinatus brassicae TaxID=862415 RepID=A0A840UJW2_9FIRM|nr:DsrE family protein [Pectinatus brassicae]MBB5337289.1 hypothetical protein [Pectinatus brassicae]
MLKVVIHIDEFDKWQMVINNIKNFIADVGDNGGKIAVVVNGAAVNISLSKTDKGILTEMEKLTKKHIQWYFCKNALVGNGIDFKSLPEYIIVVPAGITKLIELQNKEGFAYIKP